MKQIPTVVTIDFDIIMAPSIEFYNHFSPQNRWEHYKDEPLMQMFYGDYIHYVRLSEWLLKMYEILPSSKVHFIYSHEKVNSILEKNTSYDIVNIDHHHDIRYGQPHLELECGNWIEKLYLEHRLESYTWIHNMNSTMPQEIDDLKLQYQTFVLNDYDLDKLNPDILIICLSPEWIPPNIRPLFDVWINMANTRYKTKFEIQ